MIEDRDTRMELPGFTTPSHPKADDRLFAQPGGMVVVTVNDRFPIGQVMPDYQFYLSTEYGRFILLQLQARTGQVTRTPNDDGTEQHTFTLPLDVAVIYPGTYELRVLVNGKEIFKKSLTVRNHPALP
jgi:hypothetical protein